MIAFQKTLCSLALSLCALENLPAAEDGEALLREALKNMQSASLSAEGIYNGNEYKYAQTPDGSGGLNSAFEYIVRLSGVTTPTRYMLNGDGYWQVFASSLLRIDTIPNFPVPPRDRPVFLELMDLDAPARFDVSDRRLGNREVRAVAQHLETTGRFDIREKIYFLGKDDGLIYGFSYRKADGGEVLNLILSRIVMPDPGAFAATTMPQRPIVVCKSLQQQGDLIFKDIQKRLPEIKAEYIAHAKKQDGRKWVFAGVFGGSIALSILLGFVIYTRTSKKNLAGK